MSWANPFKEPITGEVLTNMFIFSGTGALLGYALGGKKGSTIGTLVGIGAMFLSSKKNIKTTEVGVGELGIFI